jgi:Delta7-sterol 5-desaturase
MNNESLVEHFAKSLMVHSLRYSLLAGGLFLIFFVWKRRQWFYKKIQLRTPQKSKIRHEILWSASSILIFTTIGSITHYLFLNGYTELYTDINERGWGYLALTTLGLILWHDFYFYWTHRAMHHKAIFPYVHKVHHISNDPTPWAAFSFHPLEAIVQAGFIHIAIFTVALHPVALLIMALYQMTLNVFGHLGFEVLPKGFATGKLTKWHNTSTHHNMHHSKVNCNYGLYFNVWDRLMGTNHKDYEKTFDEVKARTANTEDDLVEQGLVKGMPKKQAA